MSEFLAARVHPWQAFRIRRYADRIQQPLGLVLTEAIQVFLSTQQLPQEVTDAWLREYREAEAGNAKMD